VPYTYPIYKLNYLGELARNLRALAAFRNLLPAGRCGRFWYNNMDHSIGQGLSMADKFLRGEVFSEIDTADREFWVESALSVPDAGQPDGSRGAARAGTKFRRRPPP
jgi:hypothetical protein